MESDVWLMELGELLQTLSCQMWYKDMSLNQARRSLVSDSYVSFLSPLFTPGVLYNPRPILLVPDQQHSMINLGVVTVAKYPWVVEHPPVSVHWDRQWTKGSQWGPHSLSGRVGKQGPWLFVVKNLRRCRNGLTFVLDSSVWVLFLKNNTAVSYVLHSPLRPWATAPLASVFGISATINKLLFWIVVQSLVPNCNCSLKGTSDGKGPAWATTPLILHRSNQSLVSPIDWCRRGLKVHFLGLTYFLHISLHVFKVRG